jgi:nitrate reductase molybdenum cofactor assembly chaperone NarJ/NarW
MLQRLADLLSYPDRPLEPLESDRAEVREFFNEIRGVDADELEELYTRTFDLNPVATLELGWHLWGEQYERGRFLADLRALQQEVGLCDSVELPDHLTVVLPMIDRMTLPAAFIETIKPGLDKISAPLEQQNNPYRHIIAAVKTSLQEVLG